MANATVSTEHFEPSLAVRLLLLFGAEACDGDLSRCLPPPPDAAPDSQEWYTFVLSVSNAPLELITLTMVVAAAVLLGCLCRAGEAPRERSFSRLLLATSLLTLIFAWAGAAVSLQSALWSYNGGGASYWRTANGFGKAEKLLAYASNTTRDLVDEVGKLTESCNGLEQLMSNTPVGPQGWESVKQFQVTAADDLREFGKLAKTARADVAITASLLHNMGTRMSGWPDFLVYSLATPAKIFGLCGAVVLLIAWLRQNRCKSNAVRGGGLDQLLAGLGSIGLASLMLVAACGSAAALGLGVASASFCLDPGAALASLPRGFGGQRDAPNASTLRPYLAPEKGHNPPAGVAVLAARRRVAHASAALLQSKRSLDTLDLLCDHVWRLNLTSTLARLEHSVVEVETLLNVRSIQDSYVKVVTSICGSGLEAIICVSAFQALIGLVCLPLLALPAQLLLRSQEDEHDYTKLKELHNASAAMGSSNGENYAMVSGVAAGHLGSRESAGSQAMGSQAMGSQGFRHSAAGTSTSRQSGTGPDTLMGFPSASKQGSGVMLAPNSPERRVHFADELGRSLFGSQGSVPVSMGSSMQSPPRWAPAYI